MRIRPGEEEEKESRPKPYTRIVPPILPFVNTLAKRITVYLYKTWILALEAADGVCSQYNSFSA